MSLGYHSLFILQDGTVGGVGQNNTGQLGVSNTSNALALVRPDVSSVIQIACGAYHTMFLLENGTVKACGTNGSGELGLGVSSGGSMLPVLTNFQNVKQVACGSDFTVVVKKDGRVQSSGFNAFGQLGIGNTISTTEIKTLSLTGVKKVACGGSHVLFLMEDGKVMAVGNNDTGQLGIGNTTRQSTPQLVSIEGVKDIACGNYHSVFIMNDNSVKSCGYNEYGQLGTKDQVNKNVPTLLSISNVKKVSCGNNHTVFLLNDGTVRTIGRNDVGQLGNGYSSAGSTAFQDPGLSDVKDIATGIIHSLFLKKDNSLWGCGYNNAGQLGTGKTSNGELSTVGSIINGIQKMSDANLSEIKFLFQQVDQFKTWLAGSWKDISGPVTKDLFLVEGVSSLSGIPTSALTNGTKILKWSEESSESKLVMTVPKTLYDASNKLYKGIGIVETASESLTFKPKTLIVNGDHTEAIFSFSLDDGVTWYTITSGEVKDISGIVGTKLKVHASLPTATSTLTALSYAWA